MSEDLKHFGVKGMKWGVRRYQPYQKGDGPKGKFIDAHKKADASKQARRDRTAAKRVSRGTVLDAKFSKLTDAHKKADAKNEASKQKVRDAKTREQEHAEKVWSDTGNKIKDVLKRQDWKEHLTNGTLLVSTAVISKAIPDLTYNLGLNDKHAASAMQVGSKMVAKALGVGIVASSVGQVIVDNRKR